MGYEYENGHQGEAPKGRNKSKKKKSHRNKNGRRQKHTKQKDNDLAREEDKEATKDKQKSSKVNMTGQCYESMVEEFECKCLIRKEAAYHKFRFEEDEDSEDSQVEIESQNSVTTENETLLNDDFVVVPQHELRIVNTNQSVKEANRSEKMYDIQPGELDDILVTGECISIPVGLMSILRTKKKFLSDKYEIDLYSRGKNGKIRVNGTKRKISKFCALVEHLVIEKMQDTTIKFKNLVQNKDALQQIADLYGVDIESPCKGKDKENILIFGESNNVEMAIDNITSLIMYPSILMRKTDSCQNKKRLTFSETNKKVFFDRKASMYGYFICETTEEMNFSEGLREEYMRRFGYDK